MLFSSSKRARSSTTQVTDLPRLAASMSDCTILELEATRYRLIWMRSTRSSAAGLLQQVQQHGDVVEGVGKQHVLFQDLSSRGRVRSTQLG